MKKGVMALMVALTSVFSLNASAVGEQGMLSTPNTGEIIALWTILGLIIVAAIVVIILMIAKKRGKKK